MGHNTYTQVIGKSTKKTCRIYLRPPANLGQVYAGTGGGEGVCVRGGGVALG